MIKAGIVNTPLVFAIAACLLPLCARAELASSQKVAAAREAFATCARTNLKTLEKVDGVTAAGLAFFVGLSCAKARDDYRAALTEAGANNVDRMMQSIDARIIDFLLSDWANTTQKPAGARQTTK